jgi:hypothetical protein
MAPQVSLQSMELPTSSVPANTSLTPSNPSPIYNKYALVDPQSEIYSSSRKINLLGVFVICSALAATKLVRLIPAIVSNIISRISQWRYCSFVSNPYFLGLIVFAGCQGLWYVVSKVHSEADKHILNFQFSIKKWTFVQEHLKKSTISEETLEKKQLCALSDFWADEYKGKNTDFENSKRPLSFFLNFQEPDRVDLAKRERKYNDLRLALIAKAQAAFFQFLMEHPTCQATFEDVCVENPLNLEQRYMKYATEDSDVFLQFNEISTPGWSIAMIKKTDIEGLSLAFSNLPALKKPVTSSAPILTTQEVV